MVVKRKAPTTKEEQLRVSKSALAVVEFLVPEIRILIVEIESELEGIKDAINALAPILQEIADKTGPPGMP